MGVNVLRILYPALAPQEDHENHGTLANAVTATHPDEQRRAVMRALGAEEPSAPVCLIDVGDCSWSARQALDEAVRAALTRFRAGEIAASELADELVRAACAASAAPPTRRAEAREQPSATAIEPSAPKPSGRRQR